MSESRDPIQRIRDLAELRDSGALTEDEFVALKAEVIGDTSSTQEAQRPMHDPSRSNARKVAGVSLILGGIALGVLLCFVIPVGGDAWVPGPGSHYTTTPSHLDPGQCDASAYTQLAEDPRPPSPFHDFVYVCDKNAITRRNIAVGVAFLGVFAGIIVLVTRRRE